MPAAEFDIYQTRKGYVAVTNPVRRQILDALAEGDRELPALMAATGKAKPTLSSVHMKELLSQGLIEAVPHATDSRRKVFRLVGTRIGSSNVPVDRLRDAVKEYVSRAAPSRRFPLAVTFASLAAAPPSTDPAVLRAQAERLGSSAAPTLAFERADELVMGVASFLEAERLARPLRLDLEQHALELAYGEALPADASAERLGTLLAGFLDGVARAKRLTTGSVVLEPADGERRCRVRFAGL